MFADEAKVYVKAGDGGNGRVAFRREKYVPRGGPAGGDGGDGGSIVFVVTPGLRTLLDFRHRQRLVAADGEPGGSKNRAGRRGEDLIVPVPEGTVVRDAGDGRFLADLTRPDQRVIIARGGRGGRGNARFTTSTERAPTFAEKGEPGEERVVALELKLIADAGLVGLPNAGKSTFLSRVSAARPKIAGYPFTTLVPNLGVVAVPGREAAAFVLADIPGLIKGAHEGSGLGDKFLRHIERTRVLVHLVDVSPLAVQDPVEAYDDVRRELGLYDPSLVQRPELVVATKVDLPDARARARRLERHVRGAARAFFEASPLTGEGLAPVVHKVADVLDRLVPAPVAEERATTPLAAGEQAGETGAPAARSGLVRSGRGFTVTREGGVFVVRGEDIERLVVMTDLGNEFAVKHLERRLRGRGVLRALRAAGAGAGSAVRIAGYEFDFAG